ncbi:unnamed protein product, partial [Prorocentrum cordatum]
MAAADAQSRLLEAEAALDLLVGVPGLADRVQVALPALAAPVRGEAPTWLEQLRRNVALHAEADGVKSIASASAAPLRNAQKGQRLGPRQKGARSAGDHGDGVSRLGGLDIDVEICEAEPLLKLTGGLPPRQRTPLRSSAEPFCLHVFEGLRCSRGAVVYSSCSVAAALGVQEVPGGAAGRALLPPVSGHAEGSDVDDVILDGEADADTSCSVEKPPYAEHSASVAAAAAAYLAAFPQALLSGSGGGRVRSEVAAGAWWRARAVVARAWLTADAATLQEGGAAGSATPPPPPLDETVPAGGQVVRAVCPLSGCAAGAEAPPLLRFLGPAWTRHAKAVDLIHMIEGDSFGLRRILSAHVAWAMARSSRGGGGGGRRSRTYWMCSCGGWNWDWRTTCLGCGYAAPPWALGAAAKAKPQADKGGWVDQPRGRRAQRQARGAATSAATSKSQTSASGASGAPSGSGAAAIERLQVAVEQLEALQAEPPDGVDCCFTDVVASQLEAKRAELAEAQRAAAEQKASSMPLSTMLHKEANAISKAEKRLRAARQSLEQKQEARGLVEAQLQKAQEEPAQLDAEVEEASRTPHALEGEARAEAAAQLRQRAAEWAGASQVPGLLMQLDKLPEAWGSSNFEVAWAGALHRQLEGGGAEAARFGGTRPLDLGSAQAPPAPGQAGTAAQATHLAPHRLGEVRGAERRMGSTAFLHASAPTDKEGQLLYQGPRFISVVGLATETLSTNGTGLAVCASSLTVAKPPGLTALRAAPVGGKLLGEARYVDGDIALQAVGAEQLVAAWFGRAGLEVVRRLRGQHLPLSAAKASCLAPSPSPGRQLGACGKSLGWTLCVTSLARNLGSVPASARRGAHEGRVRAAGALRRARRLDPIHKAGPAASRGSERTVTDNADGELHGWRPAACRSAGALPMGAERGLRMRYGELRRRRNLDPAALRAGHAVQVMAGLLQAGELPPLLMERGLEATETRHAKTDAPWKHCASPLEAEKLTRAWIDWHFTSEQCMVADLGDKLDLLHRGPQELGGEAGPGAWSASFRHEMRKPSHGTYLLETCISSPRWTQARPLDAHEQGQARCSGAERGTLRHCQHGSPTHEAQRHGRGSWLPAHRPPQGRRTDAMGGGAIAHRDGDGNLVAEVYEADGRDRCPQRTAKDGEDVEAWMLAALARPAGEEVSIDCSRHAVLGGRLAEAQRRDIERADRLALKRAQVHAVDKPTVGVHQAQAGFVQELGRWICSGKASRPGAAKGSLTLPSGARSVSLTPRGNSSAALSASAVAFSILGHALSYACAGEGEGTQELVACSKCGAYMTLSGRSGAKPRLKERCPGDKSDKGGRNQRSLWLRGPHPGGRGQEGSRAARHRVKGEGIPTLRSQGPVPERAQKRYLEWLGTAAGSVADPSATASSAGSAPAAAAEPRVAADPGGGPSGAADAAAAASPHKRRPAAVRAGNLGEFGVVEEGLAAAAGTKGGALEVEFAASGGPRRPRSVLSGGPRDLGRIFMEEKERLPIEFQVHRDPDKCTPSSTSPGATSSGALLSPEPPEAKKRPTRLPSASRIINGGKDH